MARVKIGIHIPNQRTTFVEYRDAWLHADDLGVDSIWNWDHFFPLTKLLTDPTYVDEPGGGHFESWTLLSVIGPEIKRALIGCLCHSMSYRNPALLSNMAKTLDHATGGRLILGVGAGWYEPDYLEFGFQFGTAGERLRQLEQGLEIIKQRWATDLPLPLNGSIPILIAGSGAKVTLRIVAQYADLWNGTAPFAKWTSANESLDQWCQTIDRDPQTIERSVLMLTRDLDDVDAYLDAGCTHLIYRPSMGAPIDFTHVEELLAWRDQKNGAAGSPH